MSLPPLQPSYIFRGHASQIHATTFIRHNTRLLTGDADGWVVVWNLLTRRPTAVWRAHEGSILELQEWGPDRIITHGKDNKLVVWKLNEEDEKDMSTALPVDEIVSPRRQPWLLHVLEVNTLNFCAFAHCKAQGAQLSTYPEVAQNGEEPDELLIGVPNAIHSSNFDIFHLPSGRRLYVFPDTPGPLQSPTATQHIRAKLGMVMAASLFYGPNPNPTIKCLSVALGFESGHVTLARYVSGVNRSWCIQYNFQPHTQPILGLDVDPVGRQWFLSSSADAKISKHSIAGFYKPRNVAPPPSSSSTSTPPTTQNQPHRPRNNNPPSLLAQKLAEQATSAPTTPTPQPTQPNTQTSTTSGFSTYDPGPQEPLQTVSTGHSGQQSLRIRSDGKIFATAGWDSRIRIYSTTTLKELAVLKWHGVGVYAVGFAEVDPVVEDEAGAGGDSKLLENSQGNEGKRLATRTQSSSLSIVRNRRAQKAQSSHWVAAGGKDGKVSLWEIY